MEKYLADKIPHHAVWQISDPDIQTHLKTAKGQPDLVCFPRFLLRLISKTHIRDMRTILCLQNFVTKKQAASGAVSEIWELNTSFIGMRKLDQHKRICQHIDSRGCLSKGIA